jgi:hypothetical protein
VEEVIRIAKEPLGLDHLGYFRDSMLEGVDGLSVTVAQRDEDDRREIQADSSGVEVSAVTLDGAGLLQGPESTVARRYAQMDTLGQLSDRKSPVGLEFGKNFSIRFVHDTYFCLVTGKTANNRKNIPMHQGYSTFRAGLPGFFYLARPDTREKARIEP